MSPDNYRDSFLKTLTHIQDINKRLVSLVGPNLTLKSPDYHKLSEGLLLSAWTHWEQFIRELVIEDLSSNPKSKLGREVKRFRTKGAAKRLSTALMDNPDDGKFIEWGDYGAVVKRAKNFIGNNNRFIDSSGKSLLDVNDIQKVKTMRNAVAHKSDGAWSSFKTMAKASPFSLQPNQMKGLTVGRFLIAHYWGNELVVVAVINKLVANARLLVP